MFLNELVEQQLGPGPFQPNSHIRCAFPLREDPDIAGRRFLATYEDLEPGLIFKPAICHVILKRGYDWVASSRAKLTRKNSSSTVASHDNFRPQGEWLRDSPSFSMDESLISRYTLDPISIHRFASSRASS